MRNYIILNNQRSDEISGLIIQELAPISKPLQRTQVETIDGRDGDIVTPLGYAAYDKKITIGLYGDFDINEIIAYFATQGTAIFSNEPDKYYNYQILDQIDYERLVRFRVATVTMHVQPFKYSATEGTITVDSSDTVSGDGSDIALDGTAEAPFTTLRHKGNATQMTYTGKNLFNFGKFISDNVSTQGVIRGTATYTSNSITLTATSNDCFTKYSFSPSLYPVITVPQNTNVTLSWKTDNTSGTNRGVVYVFGNDNGAAAVIKYVQDRAGYCTFNTGAYTEISFRVGVATSGDTLTYSDIQVEIGSATAYEPYVGGIPSPNPDYPQDIQVLTGDSTVKITGKNLLDTSDPHDKAGSGMTATWNNGVVEVKGTNTATSFPLSDNIALPTQIKAGTEISASFAGASVGNTLFRFFNQATSQYEALTVANPNTSGTYTLTRDADAVQLYKGGVPTNTYKEFSISNWQIELGNQATDYEEFKSQSYVLPFGDTYLAKVGDYADEPVKVDGTWYIRRAIGKVVLDGTEYWMLAATYTNCARFVDNDFVVSSAALPLLCDYFTQGVGGTDAPNIAIHGVQKAVMLTIPKTIASTGDAFKAWLASTNPSVYYPLATPTDEEITDQDLIDALDEFYGQAHSYKGYTHITATAADGNAPAVLSVEVGEDNESTVTNAGNTTSRPILTIYGQGAIGVYINDVEVLDIALGNEQYITLDSTEMDAYKDSPANLKNRLVTGDYSKLALNAGANKIRFTGIVTKYEISKYSRWL